MPELRQDLIDQLRQVPGERWHSGPLRQGPGGMIQWIEVASFKPIAVGPNVHIGLTREGHWVATAADGSAFDLTATGDYLPLFPLLEIPHENVREILRTALSKRGLNEDWLSVFPFERIVSSALRSGSNFWPNLALAWVDRLPISDLLREALVFLERNGKTQRQRHQARRMISVYRDAGAKDIPSEPCG